MPTYVYETLAAPGEPREQFEVVQSIHDQPLTVHPHTGVPVRRAVTAPNLVLRHGSHHEKNILSNDNVARKGFTKYEKSGHGEYVRTAGTQGPSSLKA